MQIEGMVLDYARLPRPRVVSLAFPFYFSSSFSFSLYIFSRLLPYRAYIISLGQCRASTLHTRII